MQTALVLALALALVLAPPLNFRGRLGGGLS